MGGHGLGVHSVLGLALISAMRSLNLSPSEVTVLYAWEEKTTKTHQLSLSLTLIWTMYLSAWAAEKSHLHMKRHQPKLHRRVQHRRCSPQTHQEQTTSAAAGWLDRPNRNKQIKSRASPVCYQVLKITLVGFLLAYCLTWLNEECDTEVMKPSFNCMFAVFCSNIVSSQGPTGSSLNLSSGYTLPLPLKGLSLTLLVLKLCLSALVIFMGSDAFSSTSCLTSFTSPSLRFKWHIWQMSLLLWKHTN